ncbi:MAG TPA: SMC-Scp complex subunit ScpB [Firmicutes bacterium]|mgnify:FL=1|nr:SMC-Scp complex subunit ScpB [Bacillota bacterium]
MNLALTTAVIEALIFASSEPVTLKEIAVILEISEVTVKQIVEDLMKEYKNQRRGIQIMEVVDGYHFVTNPECAIYLEKLRKVPRQTPLSQAALETLAIVAYKQPITRAEIEVLRGVRVDSSLSTLVERGLIQEAGRKDGPGRPILYVTTKDFLKYFGLKNLDDLPMVDDWTNHQQFEINLTAD